MTTYPLRFKEDEGYSPFLIPPAVEYEVLECSSQSPWNLSRKLTCFCWMKLLLDEIAGRTIAESYQLAFTGSIGCLIEAKRTGIIPAVRPLLDAMRQKARFWLNPRLYARILTEQGE